MSHIRLLLVQTRRLSTTRFCLRPALSAKYKSKDLWEDRFDCDLLSNDQNLIKTINTKILSDSELSNLEVDVFINIAAPRKEDQAQLQEAVKTLGKFRMSLQAHTLLPSTSHAICRLFLDSEKLPSVVRLLEKRIEYGIFPDSFVLNILFDQALELEQYALASRLSSLIMLQEEFGLNPLNDNFALYSVAKYIETPRSDFLDWTNDALAPDAILDPSQEGVEQTATSQAVASNQPSDQRQEEEQGDEEEDEEDAEYIRVPFLRNPYHDNHFDLNHPRQICGKTFSMLGLSLMANEPALSAKCRVLGDILQANWADASEALALCMQSKAKVDNTYVDTVKFYLENLHGLAVDDQVKQSLVTQLDRLPRGGLCLSGEADARHEQLKSLEGEDIERFRQDLKQWSEFRFATRRKIEELENRKNLIGEIRAKKNELKHREQYLFFYENLKKSNLARINFD